MDEKYLAMLNTVYTDGSVAEIIAAQLVGNREEGELFCNRSIPEDGADIDYTLFRLIDIGKNCPKAFD